MFVLYNIGNATISLYGLIHRSSASAKFQNYFIQIIPVENIPDVLPSLAFGETIYHDSQPVPQYIEAENNDLDRGLTKDGKDIHVLYTNITYKFSCFKT